MNLKSRCGILPVSDSMSDIKPPPEDQACQRSTESKALAEGSHVIAAQMAASATALPLTISPYSLIHNTLTDSPVLPTQVTKNSEVSLYSSVTAGLQLNSIDWKGTLFSALPARGVGTHDPKANLTECLKHRDPLVYEIATSSSEDSDAMQSDQHHSDSVVDLVSDDAMEQLQKWSLSERILKKSSSSKPLLSEDIVQVETLECFKQTKETLSTDKEVSSLCQFNKQLQGSKNVLSENCARKSSVPVDQDQYKKADNLAKIMQKDCDISSSTSLAFSGQPETLHPGHRRLPAPKKPADVGSGCHIEKACTQTAWKTSKKSVCWNRCSSSEDSDDMNKNLICEQQKRQPNPSQFKKCYKKRSNAVTSQRTNSDSALVIKGKQKKTDFKKSGNSFSLLVSPKPSSVGEVDCSQSPEQPFERLGSGPTQQAESALLTCAWADSPLPLSERLKGRIKIS